MSPFLRTTVTIGGLLLCLFLAAAWGLHKLTTPLPSLTEDAPLCEETAVKQGDTVTPAQVTISVLNAGKRQGLASRTMQLFLDAGFHEGQSANAPSNTGVTTAEIWTDDPNSPAVKLVASRLGKVSIVSKSVTQVGVVVVVGDDFGTLQAGKASVTASADTTICSPAA